MHYNFQQEQVSHFQSFCISVNGYHTVGHILQVLYAAKNAVQESSLVQRFFKKLKVREENRLIQCSLDNQCQIHKARYFSYSGPTSFIPFPIVLLTCHKGQLPLSFIFWPPGNQVLRAMSRGLVYTLQLLYSTIQEHIPCNESTSSSSYLTFDPQKKREPRSRNTLGSSMPGLFW